MVSVLANCSAVEFHLSASVVAVIAALMNQETHEPCRRPYHPLPPQPLGQRADHRMCAGLNDEQLDATLVGTFGSIRDTPQHIVSAERS